MRTTITLKDSTYRTLKHRAAETGQTFSALAEEAIKNQLLEDLEDEEAISARAGEPSMSFDEFVKELKRDGLL